MAVHTEVGGYSPALMEEISRFRAEAFERRRRDPGHKDAWSFDPWDRVSLHVTARDERRAIIGAVRIVCGDRWPLESYCPFDYDHETGAEFGRLAVARKYVGDRRLLFDLIGAAARHCKSRGKSHFYGAVIAPLRRALQKEGTPCVTLSSRLSTYGEESYLIRFNIDRVLAFCAARKDSLRAMDEELAFAPATELARRVRTREVAPTDLVALYLERIERYDPILNSYVTVVAEQAMQQARAVERALAGGRDLPPFAGVPISIKDMSETAGIRTTMSSRAFASHVPKADTSTVRRLKEAGFILLGKTNTPEFGALPVTESALNGVCRNPWDPRLTPGGSSGGAAAALAAGLCPVAHGSDGAGSIRIPASCCGVFGLKPARGRVSSGPRGGIGDMLTDGVLARTVRDAAGMLDVMAGPEPGDTSWVPPSEHPFAEEVGRDPGRLRIGFTTRPPIECPVRYTRSGSTWYRSHSCTEY